MALDEDGVCLSAAETFVKRRHDIPHAIDDTGV